MNDSLDDIKRKALEERRAGLVEEYQALHKQLNHMLNAADRLKVQRQIDALEAEIRDVEEKLAALAPTQTVPVLIPTVPERPGPNPFTYGSAVPPKHFYGRARQRDDIRHRIGGISAQCVSVVGFRRSGKSSLLRYVRERIDEFYQAAQPPIVVHLDFQHKRFHSPAGITEGLRRSIAQQHSQSPWKSSENDDEWAVQEGLEALRGTGRRLIVLIDEFEELGRHLEQFQGWGEDWRAKASDGLFALVVATTRPLDEVYRSCGLTSPFGNIFTESTLGALEPAEWQALVRDGFARNDAPLAETPPPTATRVDRSAGIPPELSQRLRETLTRCAPFDSYSSLRDLFTDARIYPWRNSLPHANTPAAQVQATIAYLYGAENDRGEDALILFLNVLRDHVSTGTASRRLLGELAAALSGHPQGPAPTQGASYGTVPDLALIDELAGGLPLYTQMAAFMLWRYGDPALARAAFAEEARPFFAHLWEDLGSAQQHALRQAAWQTGVPDAALRHSLQRHGLLRADGSVFSRAFAEFVRGMR